MSEILNLSSPFGSNGNVIYLRQVTYILLMQNIPKDNLKFFQVLHNIFILQKYSLLKNRLLLYY